MLPLDATRAAVREYGGYSVKIDGTLPETGYMAAQLKGSKQFTPEEFFGPDGEDLIMDFMRDNAKQFDDDPDVYLGVWYDKDEKGQPPEPKVVIDVSHNIQDRDTAILAGNYQNQKSIWDVVKQEEIDTGGTGGYDEARGEVVRPSDEEGVGDVGRGTDGVVPAGDRPDPPRRPPPAGDDRPSDVVSSMGALDPEGYAFVNNGGGTLADPVHVYPYSAVAESKDKKTGVVIPATPARTLTVRQSDVAKHIRDVVEAAVLHNKKANVKASEEAIAEARQWYVTAHDKAVKMQAAFNKELPGRPPDPAAGDRSHRGGVTPAGLGPEHHLSPEGAHGVPHQQYGGAAPAGDDR